MAFFILWTGTGKASPRPFDPSIIETLKPKLNTERIEYLFGSVGVDVLNIGSLAFPETRISNLYSIDEKKHKLMRTLAIVDFTQPINANLKEIHQEILGGSAIGTTLKKHGWRIKKTPLYFSTITLSPHVMLWMQEEESNQGAIHIYQLDVSSPSSIDPIHYCTIIEIHNPQYLTIEYLLAIYSDEAHSFTKYSGKLGPLLERVSECIQSFPLP